MTTCERGGRDQGFTLVELMVAMGLFLLLGSLIMTSVLSMNRATADVKQFTNINEQARIATERLTRELRQASEICFAKTPASPGAAPGSQPCASLPLTTASANCETSMTFGVDFNENQAIDITAADPEVLTYCYDAVNQRLSLTANGGTPIPILSEQVSSFKLDFRSSLWKYDVKGGGPLGDQPDGITDWTELDSSPIGNHNNVLDAPELAKIDLVSVTLSVLEGTHRQTYQTQVGLRNLAQN